MPTPSQIAAWRFEKIAPFVDPSFDRARRRAALEERTTRVVEWPVSEARARRGLAPIQGPIPRSTLFRWISAYKKQGLAGLLPKPRRDKGALRGGGEVSGWVHFAIGLLCEQPQRSLYQLEVYLRTEFEGYRLSRASLGSQGAGRDSVGPGSEHRAARPSSDQGHP